MSVVVTRYRLWWKKPNGEIAHGYPLDRPEDWHKTEEGALRFRQDLAEHCKKSPEDYDHYFDESWEYGVTAKDFELRQFPTDQAVVILEEEYGYAYWLWHTGMDDAELTTYWKGLERTESDLKGKKVPVRMDKEGAELWSYDADTFRFTRPGHWNTPEGTMVLYTLPEKFWRGHVHMECDAWLENPEGETLHHKGYMTHSEYFKDSEHEPISAVLHPDGSVETREGGSCKTPNE